MGATEQGNLSPIKEGYEQTQAQRLAKEWKRLKTVENEKDSLKSTTSVNVQTPISVHLCLQKHTDLNFFTETRRCP